jgi:hypothetical protein
MGSARRTDNQPPVVPTTNPGGAPPHSPPRPSHARTPVRRRRDANETERLLHDQELAVSGEPTGDRELSMSRAVPVAREAVR